MTGPESGWVQARVKLRNNVLTVTPSKVDGRDPVTLTVTAVRVLPKEGSRRAYSVETTVGVFKVVRDCSCRG